MRLSDLLQAICPLLSKKLGRNIPEPVKLDALLPSGQPAFDADGKLTGLQDILEIDANSSQLLAKYLLEGSMPLACELLPGMMPCAREDQWQTSTTVASIMALMDARHSIMLLTMSPDDLLAVVQGLRKSLEQGALGQYEKGFCRQVEGRGQQGCCPASVC